MSATTCPSCGTPAMPGAIFCDNCGADLRNVAPITPPTQVAWAPPAPGGGAQAGSFNCPACGHPNVAGALFCENCGSQLGAPQPPVQQPPYQAPIQQPPYQAPIQQPPYQAPVPPPVQQPSYQAPVQPPVQQPPYQPPVQQPAYQAPVQPPYQVPGAAPSLVIGRFVIQGTNINLLIPPGKQSILIGREDPVSGIFPDVDLDPHGGQDAGVGRQHARLTALGGQVLLEDLNSVNGTALNRQKLVGGQPKPVNNGDEIRLGRLILNYYSA